MYTSNNCTKFNSIQTEKQVGIKIKLLTSKLTIITMGFPRYIFNTDIEDTKVLVFKYHSGGVLY